ncbi:MAG: SMP-30/gluconolactonase/LRE family protein [Bryobacteraceae bacterium]
MKKYAILCSVAVQLVAADPEPRWVTLNHEAGQAIEAKNYSKLRETLRELKPLLPGNPRIVYNLAVSDAVLGDTAAALAGLRNLAAMGLVYDLTADQDFAPLRSSSEFASIVRRMEQNKNPVSYSSPAFTLAERDLLPEDIAYNASTHRFLVSSVRQSKIIQTDGVTSSDFAKSDWPVLALRVDALHGVLWAATGWLPHCERCAAADRDKSALLAFDLNSGVLRQRIESPVKGLLGDMTISRDGEVYVSEGTHGAVLRLRPRSKQLERLDIPGEFPSPQTPALSGDEKTLYVPDYVRGIAAITLSTGAVTWMQPSDEIALNGIDGLYLFRNSFIAVQNGTTPARVVRFSLDLHKQQVLEANTSELGEPTHGTLVGNTFYFVANSGWDRYDDQGKKKAGTAPVISTVRKIALIGRSL